MPQTLWHFAQIAQVVWGASVGVNPKLPWFR